MPRHHLVGWPLPRVSRHLTQSRVASQARRSETHARRGRDACAPRAAPRTLLRFTCPLWLSRVDLLNACARAGTQQARSGAPVAATAQAPGQQAAPLRAAPAAPASRGTRPTPRRRPSSCGGKKARCAGPLLRGAVAGAPVRLHSNQARAGSATQAGPGARRLAQSERAAPSAGRRHAHACAAARRGARPGCGGRAYKPFKLVQSRPVPPQTAPQLPRAPALRPLSTICAAVTRRRHAAPPNGLTERAASEERADFGHRCPSRRTFPAIDTARALAPLGGRTHGSSARIKQHRRCACDGLKRWRCARRRECHKPTHLCQQTLYNSGMLTRRTDASCSAG